MSTEYRSEEELKYAVNPVITQSILEMMDRESEFRKWSTGSIISGQGYRVAGKGTVASVIDATQIPVGLFGTSPNYQISVAYVTIKHEPPMLGDRYLVNEVLSQIISKGICVPNFVATADFLSSANLDLTMRVCDRALDVFGDWACLSLEVTEDPEIDNRVLMLFVRQVQYDDDILDKIDSFRSVFEEEMSNVKNWIHIMTDFQKPRTMDCGF